MPERPLEETSRDGVDISREIIRFWWNRLVSLFASELTRPVVQLACFSFNPAMHRYIATALALCRLDLRHPCCDQGLIKEQPGAVIC